MIYHIVEMVLESSEVVYGKFKFSLVACKNVVYKVISRNFAVVMFVIWFESNPAKVRVAAWINLPSFFS